MNQDKEVIAKAKYQRISPRKARLIVDMIRGVKAIDAVEILKFTNKKAALLVKKCLDSAIANAVNNNLDKNFLVISEARIDEAPMFKRGRAVSRGRYHRILKRNSHIIIKLSVENTDKEKVTKKRY